MENEMKLEFIAKSCNESLARLSISAFIANLNPTIEEISDVKTEVSEAVTNSIVHGYEGAFGIITIHGLINENELTIEIKDNGKGIENIAQAKEPLYTTKPDEERSRNGLYNYGKFYGRNEG
jgi:stage II sporulation protein AB (anti-sigma F factor)